MPTKTVTPQTGQGFACCFRTQRGRIGAVEKGERWDSNPRMAEPQSTALTTWLRSP